MGKGVTYARRYVLQAMLGVAGGDTDVDDDAPDKAPKRPPNRERRKPPQAPQGRTMAEKLDAGYKACDIGTDEAAVLAADFDSDAALLSYLVARAKDRDGAMAGRLLTADATAIRGRAMKRGRTPEQVSAWRRDVFAAPSWVTVEVADVGRAAVETGINPEGKSPVDLIIAMMCPEVNE